MGAQFPRFFDAAELGSSLREVSTDILNGSGKDLISRWFHSQNDADLFIWMDRERRVIKQQLSFYGQVVEWNAVEGVKTGHVVIEEGREHSEGSEILRFDDVPQAASIRQALDLLAHVTSLNDIERAQLARNFSAGHSVQMSPEDFVARFGLLAGTLPHPKKPRRGRLASLFRRIWSWFLN